MAAYDRIYNFSAGPSMLPLPALERASREMMNYGGSGMSVMEMSHRSKAFQKIFDDTQAKFRRLMNVPEGYKILFLQGGASSQFSMVPLNLIGKTGKADYAVTGNFANIAYQEATKYGDIHVAASSEDQDFTYTAPTTPSTAPSGSMSPRPVMCPWCATCLRISSPVRWT